MNSQQAQDLRRAIQQSLHVLAHGPLALEATQLFAALGYRSDKTLTLDPNDFTGFQESFLGDGKPFREDKALAADWKSVDFLFQLTDAEVKATGQGALAMFNAPDYDPGVYNSFVFFSVDLAGRSYTRTQLADATREINRLFGMPAIILFRHGATVTLAVIDRRLNKLDAAKDVLEKVTLIKDIRCASPHRAHIEILFDLALDRLLETQPVTNFATLHAAWRKTLDTAALNKKFYKELADWYFWALSHVTFPPQAGVAADVNAATNVIRLITRLMFTWFLKERGLVPEGLFDQQKLSSLLLDTSANSSTFYKAILQNLFFATLNTEMDDPAYPRRFRGRNRSGGSDSHYGIPNVCRYAEAFHDSAQALALFRTIPFLNGGLFECLDKTDPATGKRVLVDGFSDRDDNPLRVPNYLFFSEERPIDLNTVYGTTNKITKVRGLLNILHSYKFTVAENTPIEEEIALDPELLGRVFENLLASYNPETGATARKQTGSFYTPREIVNYMVDEALIASLQSSLTPPELGAGGDSLNARLRHLFAYNEEKPEFTEAEADALIRTIDNLKILDPACGSGAFPMGILQKLVFVLTKLDPHNAKWRDRQIAKAEAIDDPAARDHAVADIQQAFDKNDLDYGRKLYLINSSIYGVDIQPIAMQIAKLRFFISLMIDQRIDDSAKNRGIRALPNLETKFVAANTLIGIEKAGQQTLPDQDVLAKQDALKRVRERYFSARTPATKAKCREDDKRLRAEISALLETSGLPHDTAQRLALWDPYDQNQTADFFDPEWMYGIKDGFDICIANPPYIRQESIREMKPALKEAFRDIFSGTADLYTYFYARAVQLLRPGGMLAYISPNKWFRAGYGEGLRKMIAETCHIDSITDFGDLPVFEAATTYPMIFLAQHRNGDTTHKRPTRFTLVKSLDPPFPDVRAIIEKTGIDLPSNAIQGENWTLSDTATTNRLQTMKKSGPSLGDWVNNRIYYGIKTGLNAAFVISNTRKEELIAADANSKNIIKPLAIGENIKTWRIKYGSDWLIYTPWNSNIDDYPAVKHHLLKWENELKARPECRDGRYNWWCLARYGADYPGAFEENKIVYPQIMVNPRFALDEKKTYTNQKCFNIITGDKYILGVLNSNAVWQIILDGSPALRGGYAEPRREFISSIPIPNASADEKNTVITIVDYLLLLCTPASTTDHYSSRDTLMRDYFEQIIDGLAYELYFQEEVHGLGIRLFDLLASAQLPALDTFPEGEKLPRLRSLFETLYEEHHPLRGALFQIGSLTAKPQ